MDETWVNVTDFGKKVKLSEVDITTVDVYGRTCLHVASIVGNSDVVEMLLMHPHLDLNRGTLDGSTYLHIVSKKGYEQIVKFLLHHSDINTNQVNSYYDTALMEASKAGHSEVVRLLLSHPHIDMNKVNWEGQSALMFACIGGKTYIAEILLRCPQTDINIYDDNDQSAFIHAENNNFTAIVELFYKRGRITRRGHTCCSPLFREGLQIAAKDGDKEITKMFLQCTNIDINHGYQSGKTPLYIAVREEHPHVVEVLLEDTHINVNQMVDGEHTLITAAVMGNVQIVELLLRHHNIDTNMVKRGNLGNALFFASKKGFSRIVKQLLLQPQIEVNHAFGEQQMTGLTAASAGGYISVVKLFLRCTKTNISHTDASGESAYDKGTESIQETIDHQSTLLQGNHTCCLGANQVLLRSAESNDYRAIRGLSQCPEADINIRDDKGRTPLYLASMKGHTQAVGELLNNIHIDVNLGRGLDGLSPFSIAAHKGNFEVMTVLLTKGQMVLAKENQRLDVNMGWFEKRWTALTLLSKETKPTIIEITSTPISQSGRKLKPINYPLGAIIKGIQSNCLMASLNPLPSLCAVPGRGREVNSWNPLSILTERTLLLTLCCKAKPIEIQSIANLNRLFH